MEKNWSTKFLTSTENNNIKIPKLNVKYYCKKYFKKDNSLNINKLIFNILKWVKTNYYECNNQTWIEKYIARTKISILWFLNIQEKLSINETWIWTIKWITELVNNSIEFNQIEKANIIHLLWLRSNYWIDKNWNIKIINYWIKEVIEFLKIYWDSVIQEVKKIIESERIEKNKQIILKEHIIVSEELINYMIKNDINYK